MMRRNTNSQMGIFNFKHDFYLNVDSNVILNTAKVWLHSNGFQIKAEVVKQNKSAIHSYIGSNFSSNEFDARRTLDIVTKNTPKGTYIVLHEQASGWTANRMRTTLIRDEVLALAAFLEGNSISPTQPRHQQQQQQIVYVVPPPPQQHPTTTMPAVGSVCPHCHASIQNKDAVFCDRCGEPLAPVQSAPQRPPPPPDASGTVIFCHECGTQLNANAAFCKRCGAAVEPIA